MSGQFSFIWLVIVTVCTETVYHSVVQATVDYGPFSAY